MINTKLQKTENLLKVLSVAENILSENKTENKLKYIKLANKDNKLYISGINPYIQIEYTAEAQEINGTCGLYECKTLLSLINVMDDNIEINDGEIKCKKVKYKIPCIDAEDYPEKEFSEPETWTEINAKDLLNAISSVASATDKVTEGALSGIYIGEDKILACDAKKVFMQTVKFDKNISGNIIPKELVKYLSKLPLGEKIYFGITDGNILIKDNCLKISCSKISAQYPKIEAIMPKNVKNTLTINRNEFYNAIIMVAPIIDDITKTCILEYNDQDMIIKVNNGADTAETRIEISSKEEIVGRIEVKFNIDYLIDMLRVNKETIEVKTYEDSMGYMFSAGNSTQYIMPMIN